MNELPDWKTMDVAKRDELLRKYADDGLYAAQIARLFSNCFRTSITSRAEHLGIKIEKKKAAVTAVVSEHIEVRRTWRDFDLAFQPLGGVEPVHFIENTGCKWAVDGLNGTGHLCCGAPRVERSSYCETHQKLATTPYKRAA